MGLEPGWVQGGSSSSKSSGAAAAAARHKHEQQGKQSGQQQRQFQSQQQQRTLLLLTPGKQVAGIAVVEAVQQAHPCVCESQGSTGCIRGRWGGKHHATPQQARVELSQVLQSAVACGASSGSVAAQAHIPAGVSSATRDALPAFSQGQGISSTQVPGKESLLPVAQSGHHHVASVSTGPGQHEDDGSSRPSKRPRGIGIDSPAEEQATSGGSSKPVTAQPPHPATAGGSRGTGAAAAAAADTLPMLSPDTSMSVSCQLGIRAVWIAPHLRRRGLATQILDIAR
jgi:hypothetical protein